MNTISDQLEKAGEIIQDRFDNDFDDIELLIAEVKQLRQQAQKNSEQIAVQIKQIDHLERLVNPPPPSMVRIRSDDTVEFNNYKPKHPMFKRAAAQSAARKTYCWLTQSSDDKKNKAKQDKLVQEYYGDKTTEKRREAIIKILMAMAKCKDKCKLQGKYNVVSAKGCGDDAAVRKFIMDKLESEKFINKRLDKKTVLTRRRAKTALKEESSAMSFRA